MRPFLGFVRSPSHSVACAAHHDGRMPPSAIDDIFAGKKKVDAAGPSLLPVAGKKVEGAVKSAAGPASQDGETKQKKKKSKKGKSGGLDSADSASATAKSKADDIAPKTMSVRAEGKRRVPETVVDPSKKVLKAAAAAQSSSDAADSKKRKTLTAEDEDFRDSRGTTRQKTEDGLAIYSEAELRLDGKGGETPLCPFDCDCCF